jgi:hypothetical protein
MSEKLKEKAFDDGGVDQLLRQTLSGHRVEPRPGLWKGISRKLLWREILRFNFTNLSPRMWMSGSAGLLIIAATIYFGVNGTTPAPASRAVATKVFRTSSGQTVAVEGHAVAMSAKTATGNTGSPAVELRSADNPSGSGPAQPFSGAATAALHAATHQGNTPAGGVPASIIPTPVSTPAEQHGSFDVQGSHVEVSASEEITCMVTLCALLPQPSSGIDTIISISNATGIVKFRKDTPATTRFFSASLGLTPEIAFYSEPDVYSKTNFWLNGLATWNISRFSASAGFALGYVFDEGKYRVEYKTNDSIGYFTGVTSYSVGQNNEILFNTQTISVYDSLQHSGDYRTRNRYTYLQLPLMLGYRIFESNRMSLTFRAGPAISLLLGSRESDPVIEYSNARIIRVDDDTPSRVKTNWQLWSGLYLEMRMNKQVSIYLEPSFKYYFKPMVSTENTAFKAPWTIGLGVGLQFNFGQKKTNP